MLKTSQEGGGGTKIVKGRTILRPPKALQEERVMVVKDATYAAAKRKPEQIKGFFSQPHNFCLSMR